MYFQKLFLLVMAMPFILSNNLMEKKELDGLCGPTFTTINNTNVSIEEISLYNSNGDVCSITNIPAYSSGQGCLCHVGDPFNICIKIATVPPGGAYLKVWAGSTLLDCMYVSAGSSFSICSLNDFNAYCGPHTIEFTTTAC